MKIITTILSFLNRNFNFNVWTRASTGEKSYFLTLFGFTFIFGTAGNLIRPCIHLDRMKTITIRFNFQNEIMVYLPMTFASGKTRPFHWNWNWLARKYGKAQEAPHGTVFFYSGILGNHCDV